LYQNGTANKLEIKLLMAIITLTSDWGDSDYYAAAVKGTIYSQMPDARIIDITHKIPAFQIAQAAYVLRNTYPHFPDGTVHIIAVNTEESMKEPHTVAYYHKQYFIGTDNGIFSLLFDKEPEKVVALDISQKTESFTFSSRDRFAMAAVHLADGGKMEDIGTVRTAINPGIALNPIRDKDRIRGVIVHIDNYQNIVTNISKDLLNEFVRKHAFQIQVRSGKIHVISDSYGDVSPGSLLAIFSANDMLEIAMNQGTAAPLLGVKVGDAVIVELID
jgi:S-adenosylmethionine hydrolase